MLFQHKTCSNLSKCYNIIRMYYLTVISTLTTDISTNKGHKSITLIDSNKWMQFLWNSIEKMNLALLFFKLLRFKVRKNKKFYYGIFGHKCHERYFLTCLKEKAFLVDFYCFLIYLVLLVFIRPNIRKSRFMEYL